MAKLHWFVTLVVLSLNGVRAGRHSGFSFLRCATAEACFVRAYDADCLSTGIGCEEEDGGCHTLLIEGAAGVAIAGFLKEAPRLAGKKVAIVICGANISTEQMRVVLAP